jgi:hypothetical protein
MRTLFTFTEFSSVTNIKQSFLNGRFYRGWNREECGDCKKTTWNKGLQPNGVCEKCGGSGYKDQVFNIRGICFIVHKGKRFIDLDRCTLTGKDYDTILSRK